MSSFFSSLKEKAQSAVSQTPLAAHMPSSFAGQPDNTSTHTPGQAGGGVGGFTKSHAFESLSHQLRTFQQQYSSSTTPVQKIVTTGKGIAIDLDNVSRDLQSHSKEIYLWGQGEQADLKDVTDRLGWLNYVQGSLSANLATQMNASRVPFKALRDAENALAPRRSIRVGFENQIARIEHDQRKDGQNKLSELRAQLKKAQADDEPLERELELLKRKAIRESEQIKWEAIREYAEKLTMIAQAATAIIPALPPIPPSSGQPYKGEQTTASVRASLQKALDNYTPGNVSVIFANPSGADLRYTKSFGETHAQELSRIGSIENHNTNNIPITPPPTTATAPPPTSTFPQHAPSFPQPVHSPSGSPQSPLGRTAPATVLGSVGSSPVATAPSPANMSPPLNPANLNQAPAPIPIYIASASPLVAPNPMDPTVKVPSVTPTVAETGVPKSAGPDGPGPVSGSLLDKRASSPPSFAPATQYESAEEEKQRLAREERNKILTAGDTSAAATTPKFESAEEEKKRLEREERERILREGGENPQEKKQDDGELPPYQEF